MSVITGTGALAGGGVLDQMPVVVGAPVPPPTRSVPERIQRAAAANPQFGTTDPPRLARRTLIIAGILGWAALVAGLVVLVLGWCAGAGVVALPGSEAMRANTAVAIACGGFVVVALRRGWDTRLAVGAAVLVSVIGLVAFLENVIGFQGSGFDTLLAVGRTDTAGAPVAGRMGVNTAFDFLLLGSALFMIARGKAVRTSQYLALGVLVVAFLCFLGYVFHVGELGGAFRTATRMPLNTSMLQLALGCAIVFSHPDAGWMQQFVSPGAGGRVVRRYVPVALTISIAIGFLVANLLVAPGMATVALQAAMSVVIAGTCFMVWRIGRLVDGIDSERETAYWTLEMSSAALEEARDALEISNRDLEQFASVAAHDLQEPLRKVTAFGSQLSKHYGEQLEERGLSYVERMVGGATRMQTLIDDILTFTRVSTTTEPFVSVDLSSVAAQVVVDLEASLDGGSVEIGQLPAIEANQTQIYQLLLNLVGNALKFRRGGVPPTIRIRAELPSELLPQPSGRAFVSLTVEDNGIGFEPQYADQIFTVFERLHGRSAYEGTGIGLAVCRRIAQRHGGSITATGIPGEGATFVVRLPYIPRTATP